MTMRNAKQTQQDTQTAYRADLGMSATPPYRRKGSHFPGTLGGWVYHCRVQHESGPAEEPTRATPAAYFCLYLRRCRRPHLLWLDIYCWRRPRSETRPSRPRVPVSCHLCQTQKWATPSYLQVSGSQFGAEYRCRQRFICAEMP